VKAPPAVDGSRTVTGFMWIGGSFGVQAVAQFAVLALLARFLSATEFGLVSAALVVVGFVRILTDAIVGPALTQRRVLTPAHEQTAFLLTTAIGLVASVLLWTAADAVAAAFSMPALAPVVRGLAPMLLLDSLSTVPIALLQRDHAFRRLAKIEGLSFLLGFAVPGCVLAIAGAGVWALVAAELGYVGLRSLVAVAARPHAKGLRASAAAAGDILRYGGGHTLGRVFNYSALQGDYVVVGRWLSADALGIYGRAYQLAVKPGMYLGQALDKVLFPVMASLQHDRERLTEAFRRTVSLAASLSAPFAVVGVVLAPEVVRVVLGPGWDEVIAPFRVLVAGLVARTGYKPCDSLARATGVVYRRAWRQVIYAVLVVTGALLGVRWGLSAVAGFVLLAIVVNYLLMADLGLRVLGMSRWLFVRAHARGLALATTTATICVPVTTMLRDRGTGSFGVLAGTLLVLAAAFSVAMVGLTPARIVGPDLAWLGRRVRAGARRHRPSPTEEGTMPPADDTDRGRGAIVAVVGADGSGKSTLTDDLVSVLARDRAAERLYLGSGDGPASWYRAPLKLARDVISPPKSRERAGRGSSAPSRGGVHAVVRLLWAVALAREKVAKTRRASRARAAGVIVVCDRYPQTQYPGGHDGPLLDGWRTSQSPLLRSVARWESRTYEEATNVAPDLVLKLDVPTAVALARRPTLAPDYLEARTSLVRALDLGRLTVVLDASQPYETVRGRALAEIIAVTDAPRTPAS
jgi:O-antigen/teichoic acid export membrane protein/thymidylate kinase